ncbi:hypothetical protein CPC08DRAFT_715515 [Agrocybe pediades]|nr:hypothetical protein CPC08DRAFT_715515 [Agrocybe pediades]
MADMLDMTFVENTIRQLEAVRYIRVVVTSMVLYDYLITFDREVHLIWKRRLSIPCLLFLAIRYYALFVSIVGDYALFTPNISDQLCTSNLRWELCNAYIFTILTEIILQIRLHALYKQSKLILTFMIVCFISATAVSGWYLSKDFKSAVSFPFTIGIMSACSFPTFPKETFAVYIPVLAFEVVLCILALYKGFETFVLEGLSRNMGKGLLWTFCRDSVILFLIPGLCYTACLVVWLKTPNAYIEIPATFAQGLVAILCGRTILNLREAASSDDYTITGESLPIFSGHVTRGDNV